MTVGGTVTASSDLKYKENIRNIENALDIVLNMKGVLFDRRDTGEKDLVGFIAQDLKQILPNVVFEDEKMGLSISYQNITAVLVEAIKQINNKINSLDRE
jgi:hypothetical protein